MSRTVTFHQLGFCNSQRLSVRESGFLIFLPSSGGERIGTSCMIPSYLTFITSPSGCECECECERQLRRDMVETGEPLARQRGNMETG